MRNPSRASGYGALLVVLLSGGVTIAGGAATLPLGNSTEIPAAQGTVRLHNTKNGNVQIKLSVKHLAPPGRIVPGSEVFVVWARGLAPGAEAQNLGALKVDKKLSGKITTVTAMSSFNLFITCQQSQTVTVPTGPELLPLHYDGK